MTSYFPCKILYFMFEKTKLIITDDHASNKGISVQFCNTHYFDFRLVNFLKLEWFFLNIRKDQLKNHFYFIISFCCCFLKTFFLKEFFFTKKFVIRFSSRTNIKYLFFRDPIHPFHQLERVIQFLVHYNPNVHLMLYGSTMDQLMHRLFWLNFAVKGHCLISSQVNLMCWLYFIVHRAKFCIIHGWN